MANPFFYIKNRINKLKQENNHTWIFVFEAFILIQLMLIFVFNLTRLKYVSAFDSSAAMAQAMEIWKQKTIFIKHWDYQSTLGLDSMLLVASLFYGITKNIFLSYGIADCLGVILYLIIFHDIFNELNIKKTSRLIIYIFLLTPYSLEPLGYMPMMFTNASYYVIKALIPVMLIDILIKIYKGASLKEKKNLPLVILFLVSIYFTGFSCGLYIFICVLFPVILYELYITLLSGSLLTLKNKRSIFLLITLLIYGAGSITTRIYGASAYTNEMVLCQVNNFLDNLGKCIVGIAELFGALPYQEISVTSFYGIHYLSHFAALLIFIFILFISIKIIKPLSFYYKKMIKISDNEITNDTTFVTNDITRKSCGYALTIIIINFAVLILTNTTYGSDSFEFRYHLIPFISSFIITGCGINHIVDTLDNKKLHLLKNTGLTIIVLVWMLCNVVFLFYYRSTNNYDKAVKIHAYIKNNTDCSVMYFIGYDADTTEISRTTRLLDEKMAVADAYEFGMPRVWGCSRVYVSALDFDKKTAVICKPEDEDDVKNDKEITGEFYYQGEIENYKVYIWEPDPSSADMSLYDID